MGSIPTIVIEQWACGTGPVATATERFKSAIWSLVGWLSIEAETSSLNNGERSIAANALPCEGSRRRFESDRSPQFYATLAVMVQALDWSPRYLSSILRGCTKYNAPLVYRLEHRPFTSVGAVQFRYGVPILVVQTEHRKINPLCEAVVELRSQLKSGHYYIILCKGSLNGRTPDFHSG